MRWHWAQHLEQHEKVQRVWYPGLSSHAQHAIALEQMPKFGAMLTFDVGSAEAALKLLERLELACFAASLGGVRTTTQIPATMAFLDIPEEQRREMDIFEGMVRVSAGIEDAADLIADFDTALQ